MSIACNFIDADTFTTTGNYTAECHYGRRLFCECGVDGNKGTTITGSLWSDPLTTVNMLVSDSEALTSNLTGFKFGPGVTEDAHGSLSARGLDHDKLTNFSAGEHRVINDSAGNGDTTDLWSADKITSEISTISGGSDTFIGLSDTPSVYDDGKYLRSTTTGIEWTTASGVATTTVSGWSIYDANTYYADFEHNLSTEDISVFVVDTVTNKEVGVEDIEVINGNTVRVYVTDNTSSLKINIITGGFGTSQIGVSPDHVIYVAKNGSDSTETGGINNPFLTIKAANDYAISLLNPVVDWDECVVVKVAPGKYTEHLTNAHRRVYIISDINEFEGWPKDVVIYNTGADEAHYPIDVSQWLNLVGIEVKVDTGGIYGRLINKGIYSSCNFSDGYFINNPDVGYMTSYFNFCYFSGDGFKLEGANDGSFIAFRRCDLDCSNTVFGTTVSGSSNVLKFHSSMCSSDTTLSGNWSLLMQNSELYADGALTFDTDGFVDIYNSIIINGIHFVSDTSDYKRFVNCYYKDTTTGQTDITVASGTNVTIVDYSGNKQENGLPANFQISGGGRDVGGFAENRYKSLQEAITSIPSGESGVITLHDDLTNLAKLNLNAGSKVTIKCGKRYSLSFSGDIITLGDNQELHLHEVCELSGGEMVVAGTNAILAFEGCLYVEGYITATSGTGSMVLVYFSSLQSIVGHPVIQIDNTDTTHVIGYSRLKGYVDPTTGQPAINSSVAATNKIKVKFSTLLHGKKGGNYPIISSSAITVAIYASAGNANLTPASAGITNAISGHNNTDDTSLDF